MNPDACQSPDTLHSPPVINDCLNSPNKGFVNGKTDLTMPNASITILKPCGDLADTLALTPVRQQTTSPVLSFEFLSDCRPNSIIKRTSGAGALNAKICFISSPNSLSKDLNLALENDTTVVTSSHFLPLASPPSQAHAVRAPTIPSSSLVSIPARNLPPVGGWKVVARKHSLSSLQLFCA